MSEETVVAEEFEMEDYTYDFTADDIKGMVADAITGKADMWEQEAATESLKGAANLSMIGTLHWGSKQLRQFAAVVRSLPNGEARRRPATMFDPEFGDIRPIPLGWKVEDNLVVDPPGVSVTVSTDNDTTIPAYTFGPPPGWQTGTIMIPFSQVSQVIADVPVDDNGDPDPYHTDTYDDAPAAPELAGPTVAVDSATGQVKEIVKAPVPQDTTRKTRGRPRSR